MRLDRYFDNGEKPVASQPPIVAMPLQGFAFGPMGTAPIGQWSEIYRMAYERTIAAFQLTRYDHAMAASAN